MKKCLDIPIKKCEVVTSSGGLTVGHNLLLLTAEK